MENQIRIFNSPQFGDIRTADEKLKGTYLGVVYVLEYGSMVKIGSTNAPYRRLWTLCHQANDYGNCGTGRFAFTIGHTNFRENEKTVHNLFKDKRKIGSELFDITFEQVIGELKKLDFQDKTNEIKRNNKIFVNGMKNFITGASPKISFEKKMPLMQCDISVISNVHGYLDTNNTIWLNAEDVAKGFGFTTVATSGNDTVRWSRVNKYLKEFGYNQEVSKDSYLPENMVYRLGFKANNATARKFQSVLADEVLPAIRKTGGYIATKPDDTPDEIMARALLIAQDTMKRQVERIARLKTETRRQAKQIEDDAPKVLFANAMKASDRSILVGELAKILKQNGYNTGQKRLFAWLREHGFLMKGRSERNQPTQRSMEQGLFEVTKGVVTRPDDTVITTVTTKVTTKGQQYFINKFINQLKLI